MYILFFADEMVVIVSHPTPGNCSPMTLAIHFRESCCLVYCYFSLVRKMREHDNDNESEVFLNSYIREQMTDFVAR